MKRVKTNKHESFTDSMEGSSHLITVEVSTAVFVKLLEHTLELKVIKPYRMQDIEFIWKQGKVPCISEPPQKYYCKIRIK